MSVLSRESMTNLPWQQERSACPEGQRAKEGASVVAMDKGGINAMPLAYPMAMLVTLLMRGWMMHRLILHGQIPPDERQSSSNPPRQHDLHRHA